MLTEKLHNMTNGTTNVLKYLTSSLRMLACSSMMAIVIAVVNC